MSFKDLLGKELLFFDGAMGTMLQARGLKPGELPELWNFTHADVIKEVHTAYLKAGVNIIKTNTFGANRLKFAGTDIKTAEVEIAQKEEAHAILEAKIQQQEESLKKLDNKKDIMLFQFGFLSYGIKLICLSSPILNRFVAYFEIFTIFPIY